MVFTSSQTLFFLRMVGKGARLRGTQNLDKVFHGCYDVFPSFLRVEHVMLLFSSLLTLQLRELGMASIQGLLSLSDNKGQA